MDIGATTQPALRLARAASPDAMPGNVGEEAGSEQWYRFGPGVPLVAPSATSIVEVPKPRRRRRVLSIVVVGLLSALLTLLLWVLLHADRTLHVTGVRLSGPSTTLNCDGTAVFTASLTTDGHRGEITYRWSRSGELDGAVQRYLIGDGQRSVTLTFTWQFRGRGSTSGTVTLATFDPVALSATASTSYAC